MSERKTDTISIGNGIQYAKVASRLAAFHEDNPSGCSIDTSCQFTEGWVIFTATVSTKKGTFTGHSMDKVSGRQKQFEKQETIAVGRALAFAGYLSSGDIACAEEMVDVVSQIELDTLKTRYWKLNDDVLKGKSKADIGWSFNDECRTVLGEEADYHDRHNWTRESFNLMMTKLGVDSGVPFEAVR